MRMGKEKNQSALDFHCIYFTGKNLVLSCSFVGSFLKSNLSIKKWEWIMRVRGLLLSTLTALKSLVCCSWFTPLHFWILKIPSCPPAAHAGLVGGVTWAGFTMFHQCSRGLEDTNTEGRHNVLHNRMLLKLEPMKTELIFHDTLCKSFWELL